MKDILKNIIAEFHKDELPSLFQRTVAIPELPSNIRKAIVFIGMRRVGKTYLMFQHMKDLLAKGKSKDKLLYINFEDDRLEDFSSKDFQAILDIYHEMYPNNVHAKDLVFYFDEIQNIKGWEKFIRRLLDKENMQIFLTGSSAKSLSKEIATSLRGRSLEYEVFPLSLSEYLQYQKNVPSSHITSKENALLMHFSSEYLRRGGFPETLSLADNQHHQVIQSYVNTAVFRDVIDRHELKNAHIVKLFLIQCLQNVASPLSVTKIFNILKSRGETLSRNSLYDYLSFFEDAYLICNVPIFEFSARKRQVNPSKIYCIDGGVISGYSIKPGMEKSTSLENAVYIQLRRMNAFQGIYYYKTSNNREIDFVAQKENGEISLFQVSYDMKDGRTKNREVKGLVEGAKELGVKKGYIISFSESEILEIDGIDIEVIPFAKWALSF